MDTYSRVHTSLDAIDKDGVRAEVRVQTGRAFIEEVTPSKAGKACNVVVRVEGSDYKMNGWVPIGDPVYNKVLEAQKAGTPIDFRIETARKTDIDRNIPIKELTPLAVAMKSVNKAFAAAKLPDEEDWVFSPKMRTRVEEDPRDGQDPNSMSLEDFTGQSSGTPVKSNNDSFSGIEPPPYKTYIDSETINPGSYAAAVPVSILSFVISKADEEGLELSEKEKALLAKTIIKLTNELQNYMYNYELEKPLLDANSHTRARAIIFQLIESYYKLSSVEVSNKESLKEWYDSISAKAHSLWDWNMREHKSLGY